MPREIFYLSKIHFANQFSSLSEFTTKTLPAKNESNQSKCHPGNHSRSSFYQIVMQSIFSSLYVCKIKKGCVKNGNEK